jgi:hypothetical protein
MKNGKGEVLGVLQLINCKRNAKARLTDSGGVRRWVHPFPERAVRLGLSLASQAAVAYENSRLYRDIENLFDGFVKAAVKAIEQRDPTTSGHSQRVCEMTVALAEAVDREPRGPYGDLRFSREQMKELRYAALLHDFGKVGVREEVLVKAKNSIPCILRAYWTASTTSGGTLKRESRSRKWKHCFLCPENMPQSACACSTRNRAGRTANWIDSRNSSPRPTSQRFFLPGASKC